MHLIAKIPCNTDEGSIQRASLKFRAEPALSLLLACNSINVANVCFHRRECTVELVHHKKKLYIVGLLTLAIYGYW